MQHLEVSGMASRPKERTGFKPTHGSDDAEQSQRFIEAARELGCEENFARFEDALKRIVRAKSKPQAPRRPKRL
jgi:hypothetical protein